MPQFARHAPRRLWQHALLKGGAICQCQSDLFRGLRKFGRVARVHSSKHAQFSIGAGQFDARLRCVNCTKLNPHCSAT